MRLIPWSRQRYVLLSIAGILLPTIFLSLLGLHLVRRQYRFQNQILAEYSRFSVDYTATELQHAITDEERGIASQLQMVALLKGFVVGDELRRLEDTNAMIEGAFALGRDGRIAFASLAASAADAATPLGVAPPGGSSVASHIGACRTLQESIIRRVLGPETVQHLQLSGEVHFYCGSQEGEPYQLAAFPLYDARNEPAGVGGFFLDVDNLRRTCLARYLGGAIRAAEGRFAPDFGTVLTLLVRDEKGRLVYVHRDADATSLAAAAPLAETELADLLPGWKVGLAYVHASDAGWTRRIVGIQVVLLVLASSLVLLGTLLSMRFILRQMELARLKSYFVSNITHELKTPLAAIRLYTETLQEGRVHDRAEAEKFLEVIHRETVRLTQLITNILEFSYVENGKRRYAFAPASVGAVAREVLDSYGYQLRSNGFDVRLEIEDGVPESRIDRNALGQALLDLLDNAMKYSRDRKEIVVGVASRPNGRSGNGGGTGHVLLWVSDRGVGIPPGEERKIFEPFYRVQKGLEHDVKGSGLGLAVVKQVVEAHGGTIQVESRPGGGSTFTIRLECAPRGAVAPM